MVLLNLGKRLSSEFRYKGKSYKPTFEAKKKIKKLRNSEEIQNNKFKWSSDLEKV